MTMKRFLLRTLSTVFSVCTVTVTVQGLITHTDVASAATPDKLIDKSNNNTLEGIHEKKSKLKKTQISKKSEKQAKAPQIKKNKSANPLTARYVPSLHIDSYPADVTVTAARRPTLLSDIGTQATIVTEKQILVQQRRELSTILTRQPGLTVVRTGGFGGATSIFMRGNDSNAIRVRLDGMDINDGSTTNNAFNASEFVTNGIGRIEILRGPQSGIYGGNAMAGVINIITSRGQGKPMPYVRLEGGAYATFNQAAGVRGSTGRFHYNVAIAHYRQTGFHEIPARYEQYYNANERQRNETNVNDNKTANVRLDYDATDNLGFTLTSRLIQGGYNSYSVYDLQAENEPSYESNVQKQRERSTVNEAIVRGTVHLSSFSGKFKQVLGLGYMNVNRSFRYTGALRNNQGPIVYDPTYYHFSRLQLDWNGTIKVHRNGILLIGMQHFYNQFETESGGYTNILYTSSPPYNNIANMSMTSGYGQYQGSWHHILYGAANVRYDTTSLYGDYVTWRAAPAIHIPNTGTIIKASAGTGFTGPSMYQLFVNQNGSGYSEKGNRSLRAERLIGYDAGIEQKLKVFGTPLHFGADWYDNRVRNLIQSTNTCASYADGYCADSVYSYANVARARMYGVEAFINWKPLKALKFNLSYTWIHARNALTGQKLQRRPQNKIDLGITWTPLKKLVFSGNVLYVSSWRDYPVENISCPSGESSICVRVPGYVTLDLAVTYRVLRYLKVFARVNNLANDQYENPLGYLQPGRAGYAGFTVSY